MRKVNLNIFNEDFQDFIAALNEAEVLYILVGGYSVVIYGYQRTTGDLDIWVNNTTKNFKKLMKAFTLFGLPTDSFSETEFLDKSGQEVFTFGRQPVAIDILTKVKGLEFINAYKSSAIVDVNGLPVRLIHLNDLISAKRATGRHKDLDDLNHLLIRQSE